MAKAEGRKDDYIKFNNYSMVIEKKHILLLMDYLTYAGVEYIVSPYEADAQLAYMHKIGQIDYVVTEDSDLVLYDCGNLINKLNQSGYCELLQIKNKDLMYNNSDTEEVEEFVRLSQEQKIWMSLMVGCDYLEKVRGVGLKKGIDLIQNITSLKELFKKLKEKCKRFNDTKKYKTAFKNCEMVFKFQKVYNPYTKEMCYFQEPDEHMIKYMKTISNLDHYVGKTFKNLENHIRGDSIRKQVLPSERLSFNFKSLEYKVQHKKYQFVMNPISNLVSNDGQVQNMTKDDFEVFLSKKDHFLQENEDEDMENDIKTSRVRRKRRFANNKTKYRRSKSNELPSENTQEISIESLTREYQRPSKSKKSKTITRRMVSKQKVRDICKKESKKNTDQILQDIIECTIENQTSKPQKSNRSTRVSTKGISQMSTIRTRRKGFPRPMKGYRKSIQNFIRSGRRFGPGSQIIQMGELLEAEELTQKDLSVNISIHNIRLKNDEKVKSKAIYSKDSVVRKKRRSKVTKLSQNIMDGPVDSLVELPRSLSNEVPSEILSKRKSKRLQNTNFKKKSSIKKIKIE